MADAWSMTMSDDNQASESNIDELSSSLSVLLSRVGRIEERAQQALINDDHVAVDEGSQKVPEDNNKVIDDLVASLGLLLSRVESIEERANKSDDLIEGIERRLVRAEIRISPYDSHAVPWRKIQRVSEDGGKKENAPAAEGATNAEEAMEDGEQFQDRDIKPDEEYQIPMDIYSVVSAWKRFSRPFWIALVVISVQLLLLSLLLVDQVSSVGADLIVFPSNVPTIVHASQMLATIIAIFDQDDLRSAIENYFDGLPTRFKGDETFQRMTKIQWNFSCIIRFSQGFLSVIASFVLAVQSRTVFDVLLNFLGVKFVSELDDLSFILCKLGYFGEEAALATKSISEVIFQQDNRNKVDKKHYNRSWLFKYAHVIGVFGVLSLLMGFFLWVMINQNQGDFSTEVISMQAAEGNVPFAALFRGCYRANKDLKFDRRLTYEQIGFPESGGKFAFCDSTPEDGESAWVFVIGDLNDPCYQYVSRTSATDSFDILDIDTGSTQWYAAEGNIYGDVEVSPVLESSPDCVVVQVNRTKRICEQLDVRGYVDSNQQEFLLKSFNQTYVDSSGYIIYTYPALTHPIFVEATSTPSRYELIFFTGQSWVLTDILMSKTTGDDVSMQEYMDTDPEFKSILYEIVFLGNNVSMVTGSVNNAEIPYTPLGLRWFRMREAEVGLPYNYPTADQSRPRDEILVSCATCDDNENPCLFGGICMEDGACDCINGGIGALCQDAPTGDGVCDPYFNSELYDWDGGDCCGATCVGPACGLGGLSSGFGIDNDPKAIVDPLNALGYQGCSDPSMAPLTIELKEFAVFDIEEYYAIIGNEDGDPFCSTATINVRCGGTTYLHFPQYAINNPSDCSRTFTETINVPFGSQCELSMNVACFGVWCLNHTVSVYYGNNELSSPIRSGNVGNETRLSFGVPSKCITETLGNYSSSIFDLSTDQGIAASTLSNDGITEFLCTDNPVVVLERYALTVLNASVHLKSSNWDPFQCHGWGIPAVTVSCSNFSVTSLNLDIGATSQVGTIPTELALLRNLRELVLRGNNFTGIVPTHIGTLTSLERLELWENRLTGPIPTEIGYLTGLSALAFAANQLTGSLPTELGNLSLLAGMFFDGNRLTGPIPSEFGAIPSLATLSLPYNNLSGTLPTELGAQSINALFLYQNPKLSGTIPSELGNLDLVNLAIVGTNVSGTIPAEIGLISSLVTLELWSNQLSGTIPTILGSLPALEVLALSLNNISGTIPTELGLLSSLTGIYLHDNLLTGVLPTELGLLFATMQVLDLSNNALSGQLPSELLALRGGLLLCNLENNQFSGGAAPDICTM